MQATDSIHDPDECRHGDHHGDDQGHLRRRDGPVADHVDAFPRAYCQVLRTDPRLGAEVLLDATEPEPDLGKPAGASGPRNAPPFRPATPPCAPPSATVIWQYGESIDDDNYADIDQVRPDTPGLLAPDGTVTTGRVRPRGALMSP